MQTVGAYIFVILLGFGMSDALNPKPPSAQFLKAFTRKSRTNREYESAVTDLIARTVGAVAENIVVKIDEHLFESPLDTFALTMTASDTKLLISANSAVAAAWGFNHYMKYHANSSVHWSGKNVNLNVSRLAVVREPVKVAATD
jgi:hypothetical protein